MYPDYTLHDCVSECRRIWTCTRFAYQPHDPTVGALASPNVCITYHGNSAVAVTNPTPTVGLYVRHPRCAQYFGLGQTDPNEANTKCDKPKDLTIILDSSGSIGDAKSWGLMVDFAADVAAGILVGQKDSRVAIMYYNDAVYRHQFYTAHVTQAEVDKRFESLKTAAGVVQGGTATSKVLRMAAVLQKYKHITGFRGLPSVDSTVVFITDGLSDAPTETVAAAHALQGMGNTIFAVGVTESVSYKELIDIASQPEYVFVVDEFKDFAQLQPVADWLRWECMTYL